MHDLASRLKYLAEREQVLLKQVRGLTGDVADRNRALETRGIAAEYAGIHTDYLALADKSIEASKRSIFLQWILHNDPPASTGLTRLNPESEQAVLESLDTRTSDRQLDEELRWMLGHYYSVDRYLDNEEGLESLKRVSRGAPSIAALPAPIVRSFEDRGQMGDYWRSFWAGVERTRGNDS